MTAAKPEPVQQTSETQAELLTHFAQDLLELLRSWEVPPQLALPAPPRRVEFDQD